jgi:protein-arginine kinase activator protein McsA
LRSEHTKAVVSMMEVDADLYKENPRGFIAQKKREMAEAVKNLDFETAALLRDEIRALSPEGRAEAKQKAKSQAALRRQKSA